MAKKQATQVTQQAPEPVNRNAIITIGLDVGYGVIKAISTRQTVLFPSVLGYAREIKFRAADLAAKYPGDQITDSDGDFFIGELALSQLPAGEQFRLRGRTANETTGGNVYRLRFVKAAIGKLLVGSVPNADVVHIRIATGLPVDHMADAADLKTALIGQHRIKTDQADFVANIVEVMVMPQPYGTIYSKMLTTAGTLDPCHTAKTTGVIDVGTYTVDLALDADGEYIDAKSGSTESGVYLAQQRIAATLERDTRQKPNPRRVDEVLRTGCIRLSGEVVNYQAEVQEALEPLRNATLTKANELWGTAADIDVIYLSGGGAPFVEEAVKSAGLKQAQLVQDSQIANARGYLNYALFSAKE